MKIIWGKVLILKTGGLYVKLENWRERPNLIYFSGLVAVSSNHAVLNDIINNLDHKYCDPSVDDFRDYNI